MKILALDLARKVGWASNYAGFGMTEFSAKNFKARGAVFSAFDDWLIGWIAENGEPEMIAIEKPHFRGNDPTRMAVGLASMVERVAADLGIKFDDETHTMTLKKWATGSGKAEKSDMIAAAKRLGCNTSDDNIADAFLVLKRTESLIGEHTK